MKIGILSPSIYMYQKKYQDRIYAPGKLAVTLANQLVTLGQDVTFFTAADVVTQARVIHIDDELLDQELQIDTQQDLPVSSREIVSVYERKKYYELGVTSLAFEYVTQGKLDILHVYNALGNLAHYFVKNSAIPVVFTIHNPVSDRNTLEFWRYNKFKNQNYLSISDFQKKRFEEEVSGINIIKTIYHGVEIEHYPINSTKSEYYAFIGRVTAEKGLDYAIKSSLKAKVPLYIATWFNDVVKQGSFYNEKILPFLNEPNIQVVGTLQGEEKVRFLHQAKALLFPIRWDEPFGLVMIESMACGTPVIAFNQGSVGEIVTHGKTGIIIEKTAGAEGISKAIQQIEQLNEREYEHMRSACRAEVKNRFTVKIMAQNHLETYQELIKEHQ